MTHPSGTLGLSHLLIAADAELALLDELLALIEASSHTRNPHIVPIILFALETGMRRGEILSLEWQN